MLLFLLHIFRRDCGLLNTSRFVTFTITAHYLHYVLHGNADHGLGFLCDSCMANAWLFLPEKSDDFDFSGHHLSAQVACSICYCSK